MVGGAAGGGQGTKRKVGARKWQDEEKLKSELIIVKHKTERRRKGCKRGKDAFC